MTIGAERGELAEVGSPVLVPRDSIDVRSPLRWTAIVIAVAVMMLALCNAPTITAWLNELRPTAAIERMSPAVTDWERRTAALDGPRRWLRDGWSAVRSARFGEERPGEPGSGDAG